MPVSAAQKKATRKWEQANYDKFQMMMPKGKKTDFHAHAVKQGESLNGFVNRAIEETIKRDNERNV